MTQMDKIVVGMVVVIVVMFIVNAIRFYLHQYRGRYYRYLYSNYFEYYFKYHNGRNASQSAYLKNRLGHHRLVFNSYLNAEKRPMHDFVTIFHNKGILVCYIVTSTGEISGRDSNTYLVVKRDGHSYRIPGPKDGIKRHVELLKQKCGEDAPIDVCIFFKPNTDYEYVQTSYKKANIKDICKVCDEMEFSVRDDEIENYYASCTTHLVKGDKK